MPLLLLLSRSAAAAPTPGAANLTATSTLTSAADRYTRFSLSPDAILVQTGLTGTLSNIQDDPDAPDAAYLLGTAAVDLRVSFPTPATTLATGLLQEFRVLVR